MCARIRMAVELLLALSSCVDADTPGFLHVKENSFQVHDHDSQLRSVMHAMMSDDDDDVWYENGKPQNGLIQEQQGDAASLDDSYLLESKNALSNALGPRWTSKVVEENADKSTKAFLNGISSKKALGSLHAMMGAMGALR